jgi:glycosyltransferase involved in cell wall biosynthesis
LLVPVQDEVALAEAMRQLAADLELRSRLGQNARKRVEQEFSREKVLESLLEFYRQL